MRCMCLKGGNAHCSFSYISQMYHSWQDSNSFCSLLWRLYPDDKDSRGRIFIRLWCQDCCLLGFALIFSIWQVWSDHSKTVPTWKAAFLYIGRARWGRLDFLLWVFRKKIYFPFDLCSCTILSHFFFWRENRKLKGWDKGVDL